MPVFHAVSQGPLGRFCSHLAKRGLAKQRPSGNGVREAMVVRAGLCFERM